MNVLHGGQSAVWRDGDVVSERRDQDAKEKRQEAEREAEEEARPSVGPRAMSCARKKRKTRRRSS